MLFDWLSSYRLSLYIPSVKWGFSIMLDKQPYGKGYEQKNWYHSGRLFVQGRKEGRVLRYDRASAPAAFLSLPFKGSRIYSLNPGSILAPWSWWDMSISNSYWLISLFHEHIIFGYVIPPFLPICHPFRPLFIYRELLQTRRLISLQNPGHYLGGPYKDELKGEVIISPLSIYPSISSNWVTEYRSFCRKSSSLLPFSISGTDSWWF